jgi:hypothetical protein
MASGAPVLGEGEEGRGLTGERGGTEEGGGRWRSPEMEAPWLGKKTT